MKKMIYSISFIVFLTAVCADVGVQTIDRSDWDLWPMFTPILGIDHNSSCYKASVRYIRLLNESLSISIL